MWNAEDPPESRLVWRERRALLGAVALEYPRPFQALPAYFAECPLEELKRLGDLSLGTHEISLLLEKLATLPEGLECLAKELARWSQRAWRGTGTFPKGWSFWAFPVLALSVYTVKDLKAKGFLEEYLEEHMTTQGERDVYVLADFMLQDEDLKDDGLALIKLLGAEYLLPPRPVVDYVEMDLDSYTGEYEDPPSLNLKAGESLSAFLKRAEKHYRKWAPILNAYVLKTPPFWPTRQRDLIFLAWREVEGLSYKAIADRAQDYLEASEHPLGRILAQGWGKAREVLSEDVVAKAVRHARKQLAIW